MPNVSRALRTTLVPPMLVALGITSALADEIDVQGHRGCRGLLPENSMPAFSKALELGVTTLELDVQVTKDRVLVVFHDQRLDSSRCVDREGNRVPKRLFIETTLDELDGIDCGHKAPSGFPEQQTVVAPIPTLGEVLELARDADYPVRVSIEIKAQKPKHTLPLEEIAALLVEEINESGLAQRTMVQSFSPQALRVVRELAPELPRAILIRERGKYEAAVEESSATILSPKHTALREDDVRRFQQRGIPVIPWTVNKPADIERIIGWGVDGIISDHPDRVLDALGKGKSVD